MKITIEEWDGDKALQPNDIAVSTAMSRMPMRFFEKAATTHYGHFYI